MSTLKRKQSKPSRETTQPAKQRAAARPHPPGARRPHDATRFTDEKKTAPYSAKQRTAAGPHPPGAQRPHDATHFTDEKKTAPDSAKQRTAAGPHLPAMQHTAARTDQPEAEHPHNAIPFAYSKIQTQEPHQAPQFDGVLRIRDAVHHIASARTETPDMLHASAKDMSFDADDVASQQSSDASARQTTSVPPRLYRPFGIPRRQTPGNRCCRY